MIKQVENPAIEIHDLTVAYNKKPVLWDIDMTLPGNSIIGIIGPNGSGKTTLIKSIMDLVPLSSGYVKLFNQPLEKVRNRISYVPQRESVDWDFPASAFDVVLMGRYGKIGMFRKPGKKDKTIAMEALEKVGMQNFATRQIAQLSGGQQQRVFLARALAQQADLYFLDEPFAGVDAATENTIIELLREMVKDNKTVVVVHHDLQSAAHYFNWLVMLNMRLVASAPVKEVLTADLLQKTYGGKLTILSQVGNIIEKAQFPNREGN